MANRINELKARRAERSRFALRRKSRGRVRLCVFRSSQHIYAQIIDDVKGQTLAAASTLDAGVKGVVKTGANIEAAKAVGKLIGEILDAVKNAACAVIDAARDFVCAALSEFGDWLKSAVTSLLGSVFPELAAASPDPWPVLGRAVTGSLGFVGEGVSLWSDLRSRLRRWQKGEAENPYLGFLAVPEVLVVTGESESMLAEAVATGKPVYIYPLPERAPGLRLRLSQAVTERAYSRPRKEKGTVRPQQKSEYICARLIQHGVIRPPRDLRQLHRGLIESGAAFPWGAPLTVETRPPLRESSKACSI